MSSARLGVIKTVTHDKITTTANPIVSTRDIVGSLHPQLFPLSRVCKPPVEILVRRLHKLPSSTHSKIPPKKPTIYDALCAHQSAMKRACLVGGRREPTHAGGVITPRLASKYPPNPAIAARNPITKSK